MPTYLRFYNKYVYISTYIYIYQYEYNTHVHTHVHTHIPIKKPCFYHPHCYITYVLHFQTKKQGEMLVCYAKTAVEYTKVFQVTIWVNITI